MAQSTPCVIEDSRILELIERGLLDEYEVQGRSFDFPMIIELENNKKLQEQFKVGKDIKTAASSFLKRLYNGTVGRLLHSPAS